MDDTRARETGTGAAQRFWREPTELARRGHTRTRLDNGWVAHERSLPTDRVAWEWRFLRGLAEVRKARAIRRDGEEGGEQEGKRWRQ